MSRCWPSWLRRWCCGAGPSRLARPGRFLLCPLGQGLELVLRRRRISSPLPLPTVSVGVITMAAMATGWDAADDVDWSRLSHAYGAATDTPAHLRALVSGDTTAQQAALDHLWAAVIHQGTPWTVTPIAALVVAGLLPDPALSQPVADSISAAAGWPPLPLRAALVHFLAEVAEAMRPDLAEDELAATACPPGRTAATQAALDRLYADTQATEQQINELIEAVQNRVVLDLRATAPALLSAVTSCLTDGDPRVRVRAAHAASLLAALPQPADHRVPLAVRLKAADHLASQRDETTALVLALGALGAAPVLGRP